MSERPIAPSHDATRARIHRRRALAGPGAQAFYADACALMEQPPPLATTTHLVAHRLQEIESAMRAALQPSASDTIAEPPSESGHKDEIRRILHGLAIPGTDPTAATWLRLAGRLQVRAHRNVLAPPRQRDAEFETIWSGM